MQDVRDEILFLWAAGLIDELAVMALRLLDGLAGRQGRHGGQHRPAGVRSLSGEHSSADAWLLSSKGPQLTPKETFACS